jgi:hypothetical protein
MRNMNKYKTLTDAGAVNEGDIIEYRSQNAIDRREGRKSYGYVHHVIYLSQNKDEVKEFAVFPIQSREQAFKSGNLFVEVDQNIDGFMLGLPTPSAQNGGWCIVINQQDIEPNKKGTGRNDGLIQRIGNIYNSTTFDRVQDKIQDFGGEEKLKTAGIGPKMRRPDDDTFGKFIPLGITKDNAMESFEPREAIRRKAKPKAYDNAARVPDITLQAAVKAELIPPEIANAFKKVSGLRELTELAKKDREILAKAVAKDLALEHDIVLSDLPDDIEIDDNVWRLMYPKDTNTARPLTTLKEAYDFVSQENSDLTSYQGVDEKLGKTVSKQIVNAYKTLAKPQSATPEKIEGVEKTITRAWKDFMHGYTSHAITGDIPERFADENNQPIWTHIEVLKPKA